MTTNEWMLLAVLSSALTILVLFLLYESYRNRKIIRNQLERVMEENKELMEWFFYKNEGKLREFLKEMKNGRTVPFSSLNDEEQRAGGSLSIDEEKDRDLRDWNNLIAEKGLSTLERLEVVEAALLRHPSHRPFIEEYRKWAEPVVTFQKEGVETRVSESMERVGALFLNHCAAADYSYAREFMNSLVETKGDSEGFEEHNSDIEENEVMKKKYEGFISQMEYIGNKMLEKRMVNKKLLMQMEKLNKNMQEEQLAVFPELLKKRDGIREEVKRLVKEKTMKDSM